MTFGPLSEWEDDAGREKRFTEAAPGCPGREWFAKPAEYGDANIQIVGRNQHELRPVSAFRIIGEHADLTRDALQTLITMIAADIPCLINARHPELLIDRLEECGLKAVLL